jgi:hypothetical protein
MPSSFSTNLRIELIALGEQAGTWGTTTNTNLGTALEQAVVGLGNPDFVADADLTITLTNSNAAQAARALVLNVTSSFGSLTTTRELVVPTIQKQYIVQNNTTGSQSITVKTSAGTGITVPNGRKAHLYVDGTNVVQMFDFVDINAGTIDGTTIGASTASTGAFTTLAYTGTLTGGTGVINIGSGQLYKDASGNVGIGTSSPASSLEVQESGTGSSYGVLSATATSGGNAGYGFKTGGTVRWWIDTIGSAGSEALRFYSSSAAAERMRIDSSGNVGIGTSSPSNPLTVQKANGGDFIATFQNTTSATPYNVWIKDAASPTGGYPLLQVTDSAGVGTYFRVDSSSGNVGIGTSSPQASSKLTLRDGTAASLYFGSDGAGGDQAYIALQKSADGLTFGVENRGFVWKTGSATVLGGTERMRIDSSGQVRINQTVDYASGQLEVFANSDAANNPMTITQGAAAGSPARTSISFYRTSSSSIVGYITTTNTATAYNTSSDYRLKHDIQPMTGALATVAQLKPVTYKWNADDSESQGFIAHELQEVAPYAVSGEKDGEQMQGVDYGKITPLLTAALQEAIAEIQSLKARVAELEAK